ncbi:MAG: hypothetical protein NZR01_08935 [Bryobacteraceae bacterium]|nr:hypothetical protein [Bryobacteraceae bacterium]
MRWLYARLLCEQTIMTQVPTACRRRQVNLLRVHGDDEALDQKRGQPEFSGLIKQSWEKRFDQL